MTDINDPYAAADVPSTFPRRTVVKAAAWSIPVIAATAAVPLASASTTCVIVPLGSVELGLGSPYFTPAAASETAGGSNGAINTAFAHDARVTWTYKVTNTGSTIIPAGDLSIVIVILGNATPWVDPQATAAPTGWHLDGVGNWINNTPNVAEAKWTSVAPIAPGAESEFSFTATMPPEYNGPNGPGPSAVHAYLLRNTYQCDGATRWENRTAALNTGNSGYDDNRIYGSDWTFHP